MHEFEFGRYQFQVGDLVRRHQVGEPEQMFMYIGRYPKG
jgi:hypothetical protein